MRAATQIQSSILPHTNPEIGSFHLAVRYAPMKAVAGDFYDFLLIRPGCLGIVVADVTGHGVPAALVASVKVAVSAQIGVGAEPGKVRVVADSFFPKGEHPKILLRSLEELLRSVSA